MKVYFITQKSMGEIVTLEPRIPDSAWDEGIDRKICVSMSILGALCSIGPNLDLNRDTYIYITDVNTNEIYQPNKEVSDIDMTGELWILKPKVFHLHKVIRLTHLYDTFEVLPNLKEQETKYPVIIGSFKFYDVRRGKHDS